MLLASHCFASSVSMNFTASATDESLVTIVCGRRTRAARAAGDGPSSLAGSSAFGSSFSSAQT